MESTIKGNPYYQLFKWRRFTSLMSGSIAKNGTKSCDGSTFSHTTASGDVIPYSMIQEIDGTEYIAIGFSGCFGGNGNLSFRQIQLLYPYIPEDMTAVRNSSTSAQSGKTVSLDVILMKKPQDTMIYEVIDGQFKKRITNQDGTQSLVVVDNG